MRDLHRKRNGRPVAETIGSLLARTRAHAGFANWPTGEQALANLMRLTDMARKAEQNGLISFRAFVDWLEDQAENGEAGDAPIMEEGVDGVRMMTVHSRGVARRHHCEGQPRPLTLGRSGVKVVCDEVGWL